MSEAREQLFCLLVYFSVGGRPFFPAESRTLGPVLSFCHATTQRRGTPNITGKPQWWALRSTCKPIAMAPDPTSTHMPDPWHRCSPCIASPSARESINTAAVRRTVARPSIQPVTKVTVPVPIAAPRRATNPAKSGQMMTILGCKTRDGSKRP